MPRPRRSTAEAFYDVFADFPVEDQAAALLILEQIHRLAIREEGKRKPAAAPAKPATPDPLADLASDPGRNAALLLVDERGPKQ